MDFIKPYIKYIQLAVLIAAAMCMWLGGYFYADKLRKLEVAEIHLNHQQAVSAQLIERAEIVEGQQEVMSYVSKSYEQRLADVRSYYSKRLRNHTAATHHVPAVPPVPGPTGEPQDTSGECVPAEEHTALEQRAAEDALKIEKIHEAVAKAKAKWPK